MNLGYISAFLYVIITTISTLFIESKLASIGDTLIVLFLAIIITSLFFNIIGIRIIKKAYKNILSDFYGYLIFCLFISLVWICCIYGVHYSNGLVFNVIFFMTSTVSAYIVQYIKSRSKTDLILLILSLAIIFVTYINNYKFWVGILIGVCGGVFSYLYKRVSFFYSIKHSAGALEIMMTRFIPIILFLSIKIDLHNVLNVFANYQNEILFFAFISFIIPTYLGQYATNKIGAEQSTIISALIFPLCWFGDFLLYHGNTDKISIIDLTIAILASFVVIYPYGVKLYKTKFGDR